MIRVAIIADLLSHAHALADLLAQDERIDIIAASDRFSADLEGIEDITDVLIVAGLMPDKLPFRGPPIVMINDGPVRESLFTQDVRAWLPNSASRAELLAAITAAEVNLHVLTADQMERRTKNIPFPARDETTNALTRRELEVLRTLANGSGNKEIADQLGISDNTVKFHIAQIMAKLGAHSRTEAVAIGMKRGLVAV
ncbi:MAG: LuxR C-terminal-related transcriptional regulator [Bryobacteraceae bacterium]